MHISDPFNVTDIEEAFAFIHANAFGQLTSQVDGRPFATHLPVLLSDDKKSVYAHIARANPQHKSIAGQEVLLSLTGPHGYISPTWYVSHGVPTWNYQALHIYGECTTFDDADRLKEVVDALTAKYEQGFAEPWVPNYPASMLRGIVGLEIAVKDIQCSFKLSQNRPSEDHTKVIEQLRANGEGELAEAMQKHPKK